MFTNEQIAHDIAIARMAGKQLSAPILVEEHRNCYENVFKNILIQKQKHLLPPKQSNTATFRNYILK